MSAAAGRRPYRSPARAEQARLTRRRVVRAAGELFLTHGYVGTTMRAVAGAASVSVATVELAFGTKAGVLKAAVDVAIAGDDEPVPVLSRPWYDVAAAADTPEDVLAVAVGVLGPAMERSAGLVLAVLEAARTDPDLAALADRLLHQRQVTATALVDLVGRSSGLRPDLDRQDAVDTMWSLMEPALFVRLVRDRGWSLQRYQDWVAASARRLLVPDPPPEETP